MDSSQDPIKQIRKALFDQRKAFEDYIAPERPHLWRYCQRLTGSLWDGEDLVQETLLAAFGRLIRYWSPMSPRAYLFKIATRLWMDSSRGKLEEQPLNEEDVAAVTEEDLSIEGVEALELMVTSLPPRQRVVLLLTQVFEFTAAEAGEMLDMTEGAVKAVLHRARRSLAPQTDTYEPARTTPQIVLAFVDAFNKRDLEALCALFHENVAIDIVGVAEERGREELKESSMKHTIADEDANDARVFWHLGEPLVLYIKYLPEGGETVSEVTRLTEENGEITYLRTYYFCPETLGVVAEAYGRAVHTHGYL